MIFLFLFLQDYSIIKKKTKKKTHQCYICFDRYRKLKGNYQWFSKNIGFKCK